MTHKQQLAGIIKAAGYVRTFARLDAPDILLAGAFALLEERVRALVDPAVVAKQRWNHRCGYGSLVAGGIFPKGEG